MLSVIKLSESINELFRSWCVVLTAHCVLLKVKASISGVGTNFQYIAPILGENQERSQPLKVPAYLILSF